MLFSVKPIDVEAKIGCTLRTLLSRIPFVEVAEKAGEHALTPMAHRRPDTVFQLSAAGRRWQLVVESKRTGQPREARVTVLQLKEYLARLPSDQAAYGVFVAPFISEASAKICTEGGVGYADFSGNARLAFDGVYIETRSADNPFKEARELRSLFTPKAERVLKVLLTPPLRFWKVADLAMSAAPMIPRK